MMSFCRNSLSILCGAILATCVGCTNADLLFGNGLVPPSQNMETFIDSSMTVRTSIFKLDSIQTSNCSGAVYLGSMIDEMVGRTTVSFVTTFVPLGFKDNTLFGTEPTLDSMRLLLSLGAHRGDTTRKFRLRIYEITDTLLSYKKSYFSNFKPDRHINKTPLADLTFSGGRNFVEYLFPKSFYNRFLYNTPDPVTNPYYADSNFLKVFKGFYFQTDMVNSGQKGAMYSISLGDCSMKLHYHNKNAGKPDTTSQTFIFYNSRVVSNVNIVVVDHDYSFANVAKGGVDKALIGDSTLSVSSCYVQGLAGLGARVELDTARIGAIKRDAIARGYSHVALQRAALTWDVPNKTYENYNESFARLGLYYNYAKARFIPDYDPVAEATQSGFISDMGGTFNRSRGVYTQVITSTVQKLFNDKNANRTVQLMPSLFENLTYGDVVVGGSASAVAPPKMVLVYTLIK